MCTKNLGKNTKSSGFPTPEPSSITPGSRPRILQPQSVPSFWRNAQSAPTICDICNKLRLSVAAKEKALLLRTTDCNQINDARSSCRTLWSYIGGNRFHELQPGVCSLFRCWLLRLLIRFLSRFNDDLSYLSFAPLMDRLGNCKGNWKA
jgi:hypothetical protein